jgi:SAM-dependent methyltransferase
LDLSLWELGLYHRDMPPHLQALVLGVDLVVIAITIYIIREMLVLGSIPPFIRTRWTVTEEIADTIGPLPPGSVVFDPGCGDGRVLRALAKRNPGARFVGIELRWYPYFLGLLRCKQAGLTNIELRRGNMYAESFAHATHLYTYLYSEAMNQLLPKLEREVQPGTILVSLDFPFSDKEVESDTQLASAEPSKLGKKLYVYRF